MTVELRSTPPFLSSERCPEHKEILLSMENQIYLHIPNANKKTKPHHAGKHDLIGVSANNKC